MGDEMIRIDLTRGYQILQPSPVWICRHYYICGKYTKCPYCDGEKREPLLMKLRFAIRRFLDG